MPTAPELRGWSRLLATVGTHGVTTIHDLHRATSDGVFRVLGPLGAPVRRFHDPVIDGAYRSLELGLQAAGELGALAADQLAAHNQSGAVADRARSIAHGVLDERFLAVAPELDLEVSVRVEGREVTLDPEHLHRSFPDAGERVVVFVHGLVHNETVWFARATPDAGPPLPDLAAEQGFTPVLIRYGSGHPIGRNGVDLANLLDRLVAAWPVPVGELTIVGHSMGGLVARAAAVTATQQGLSWTTPLAHVVYLGSPHLGSWLEKVANVTSWTMRRVSGSAPLGRWLDGRSRGIKDLRFGTLLEEHWGDADVDELLTGLARDEPWLTGVEHHLIVGRLRPEERHLLNLVFGDSLVRAASAAGAGRIRRIAGDADVRVVPVSGRHVSMVRHPEIAALLAKLWAQPPAAGPAGTDTAVTAGPATTSAAPFGVPARMP